MKHQKYNEEFSFVKSPIEFNKYTDIKLLRYCLGATMYMPGTKDFTQSILTQKLPGLTSMVMCFEDACKLEDVPAAEENVIRLLTVLCDELEKGTLDYNNIPLLIFRVRNVEQFKHFTSMLHPEHIKLITAFNFPKFDIETGEEYFKHLKELNEKYKDTIYGMPILESVSMAFCETRERELMGVKEILDRHKELVLNIRVGGTDFSSCFGVRRSIRFTIYDILTVRDCLKDILNVFSRNNDYTVSGPVWEYFKVNKNLKFEKLETEDLHESLLKHETIISDAIDGLLREMLLDLSNGFIGKTIIHPTHLNYINGMLAVTEEEYEDACQILNTSGGVIKSTNSNKMNEIGPHKIWAEKLYMRAQAFGVIKNESEYLELFGH